MASLTVVDWLHRGASTTGGGTGSFSAAATNRVSSRSAARLPPRNVWLPCRTLPLSSRPRNTRSSHTFGCRSRKLPGIEPSRPFPKLLGKLLGLGYPEGVTGPKTASDQVGRASLDLATLGLKVSAELAILSIE